MKMFLKRSSVFLSFFLFQCSHPSETPFFSPLPSLAVWSEYLPVTDVILSLPILKKNKVGLYQAVHMDRWEDPLYRRALQELFQEGGKQELDLRAWIVLSMEDGYWPNEENREIFSREVLRFTKWVEEENLPVSWIVVDMELSIRKVEKILTYSRNKDLSSTLNLFLGNRNPPSFLSALKRYRNLVEELHRKGWKVMCVTFPIVLDDLSDGDPDLMDFLDLPVYPIDWDEISFMVYRTTYNDLLGKGLTSYLVYSYALSAKGLFGEKAGIDVGLVAPYREVTMPSIGGTFASGYATPEELKKDIASALLAGVQKIHIWPLDHIVTYPDPSSWLTLPQPLSSIEGDGVTDGLREGVRILDESIPREVGQESP